MASFDCIVLRQIRKVTLRRALDHARKRGVNFVPKHVCRLCFELFLACRRHNVEPLAPCFCHRTVEGTLPVKPISAIFFREADEELLLLEHDVKNFAVRDGQVLDLNAVARLESILDGHSVVVHRTEELAAHDKASASRVALPRSAAGHLVLGTPRVRRKGDDVTEPTGILAPLGNAHVGPSASEVGGHHDIPTLEATRRAPAPAPRVDEHVELADLAKAIRHSLGPRDAFKVKKNRSTKSAHFKADLLERFHPVIHRVAEAVVDASDALFAQRRHGDDVEAKAILEKLSLRVIAGSAGQTYKIAILSEQAVVREHVGCQTHAGNPLLVLELEELVQTVAPAGGGKCDPSRVVDGLDGAILHHVVHVLNHFQRVARRSHQSRKNGAHVCFELAWNRNVLVASVMAPIKVEPAENDAAELVHKAGLAHQEAALALTAVKQVEVAFCVLRERVAGNTDQLRGGGLI
mmetsp:Transcript_3809/g.11912  ORF Transcript_3809/g.11912 Transcript_3809/m.11912 type:complete len:464 (-) Transcript_3809:57-1448(-)